MKLPPINYVHPANSSGAAPPAAWTQQEKHLIKLGNNALTALARNEKKPGWGDSALTVLGHGQAKLEGVPFGNDKASLVAEKAFNSRGKSLTEGGLGSIKQWFANVAGKGPQGKKMAESFLHAIKTHNPAVAAYLKAFEI